MVQQLVPIDRLRIIAARGSCSLYCTHRDCDAARLAAEVLNVRLAQPNPTLAVPGPSTGDPESDAAARSENYTVTWANDRGLILRLLYDNGPRTADSVSEGMDVVFGKATTPNQVASRLQELRRLGLVQYRRDERGQVSKRFTRRGARAKVQELSESGRMWVLAASRDA